MSGFNKISQDETFYLPDVISGIVTSIQTDNAPYFRWGYWKEIVDILDELGRNESSTVSRFPMIYLSLLYKAKKLNARQTISVDFDLFIITDSLRKYSSSERLTNTFKLVIEPIYDDFMTSLLNNRWFFNQNRTIEHDEENIFKVGADTDNKNKMNQIIDAKHLSFKNTQILNLKNY